MTRIPLLLTTLLFAAGVAQAKSGSISEDLLPANPAPKYADGTSHGRFESDLRKIMPSAQPLSNKDCLAMMDKKLTVAEKAIYKRPQVNLSCWKTSLDLFHADLVGGQVFDGFVPTDFKELDTSRVTTFRSYATRALFKVYDQGNVRTFLMVDIDDDTYDGN